jgi:hypothetical protein
MARRTVRNLLAGPPVAPHRIDERRGVIIMPIAPSTNAARDLTYEALEAWGLSSICDDTALLVDELVRSALGRTAGPIALTLTRGTGLLRVEVTEHAPSAAVTDLSASS